MIDAERIELADDSVDGVLCRFGYMLMADPAAAFAETRRVLRPGGRLALAVWGASSATRSSRSSASASSSAATSRRPSRRPRRGRSAWRAPSASKGCCASAGFAEVRTEEVRGRFVIPDVDEYLSVIADTAGPIALALQGLAEADRAAVRADVEDSLGDSPSTSGYELPCVALCAVARSGLPMRV